MFDKFFFSKGNNFCDLLFVALGDEALSKRDLILIERLASSEEAKLP